VSLQKWGGASTTPGGGAGAWQPSRITLGALFRAAPCQCWRGGAVADRLVVVCSRTAPGSCLWWLHVIYDGDAAGACRV